MLSKLRKLADPEIRAKNLLELRRKARGVYWDLMQPSVPDPVFVVGCSRSGTTITYDTIAASGRYLTFGYEIPAFWDDLYGPRNNAWESEAAGPEHAQPHHRDAALRFFYQRLGRGQVLEKTCINTLRMGYLHKLFRRAHFVFIHRDGRDNISSMIDGWRLGRTDGGFGLERFLGPAPEPVAINQGEFREWHFFLPPGWRDYNRATLEEVCAFQWITANRLALAARDHIDPRQWIEVRYEDIFTRPVEMFRGIFERLAIPFDAAMEQHCRHLSPTSIVKGAPRQQKWKDHNPEAIARIADLIRPTMQQLGYA